MTGLILMAAFFVFTFLAGGYIGSLLGGGEIMMTFCGIMAVLIAIARLIDGNASAKSSGQQPQVNTGKSSPTPPEKGSAGARGKPAEIVELEAELARELANLQTYCLDQQDVVREEIAKLQRALMKRAVDLDRSSEGSTVFGVMGDKSVPEMRTERALRNAKAAQKTLTLSRPWKGGMY